MIGSKFFNNFYLKRKEIIYVKKAIKMKLIQNLKKNYLLIILIIFLIASFSSYFYFINKSYSPESESEKDNCSYSKSYSKNNSPPPNGNGVSKDSSSKTKEPENKMASKSEDSSVEGSSSGTVNSLSSQGTVDSAIKNDGNNIPQSSDQKNEFSNTKERSDVTENVDSNNTSGNINITSESKEILKPPNIDCQPESQPSLAPDTMFDEVPVDLKEKYQKAIQIFGKDFIDSIIVEKTYRGLNIESFDTKITIDWIETVLIPFFEKPELIHRKYAYMVMKLFFFSY